MKVERSETSSKESFQEELIPPQVKELEIVKLNQCIVMLVGEEDKGL